MNELYNILELNKKERAVLADLVKVNIPVRSAVLAGNLGLPRQTVCSILTKFVDKGMIVQTDRGGIKYFYTDVRELVKFIDIERGKLLKTRSVLRGDKSYLVKSTEKNRDHVPKVEFYSGATGIQKLFESILDIYKKAKSKRFRGYGINHFAHSKALENYLDYFIRKRAKYSVQTNLFIAKGPDGFNITNESSSFGRSIKRIDSDPQMAGVYIVSNRIYLFSYKDNIGIMIENSTIVSLLKSAFDDHWDRS